MVDVDIHVVGPMAVPSDLEPELDPQDKFLLTFKLVDDIENPTQGTSLLSYIAYGSFHISWQSYLSMEITLQS